MTSLKELTERLIRLQEILKEERNKKNTNPTLIETLQRKIHNLKRQYKNNLMNKKHASPEKISDILKEKKIDINTYRGEPDGQEN
jgi:hypothetical protein